jgi:gas vesicle protein
MGDKTSGVDFIAGFVVGALVGAAAALLLAPQSGEETRIMIRDKGIEIKDRADEMSVDARRRAEELQTQAKERAEGLQGKVKEAVEEGKTAAAKTKEELLTKIDQEQAAGEAPSEA